MVGLKETGEYHVIRTGKTTVLRKSVPTFHLQGVAAGKLEQSRPSAWGRGENNLINKIPIQAGTANGEG